MATRTLAPSVGISSARRAKRSACVFFHRAAADVQDPIGLAILQPPAPPVILRRLVLAIIFCITGLVRPRRLGRHRGNGLLGARSLGGRRGHAHLADLLNSRRRTPAPFFSTTL